MTRGIRNCALAGLALVLVAAAAAATEGTWVADSGKVHPLTPGSAVFVSEDNAERYDLSGLRDGETRVFGAGPRAVTARRSGDSVALSRTASGDDVSSIDITCRIGDDTCTVLTFPNDPNKVMIAIEKERTCVNGVGDCDFEVDDFSAEGQVVVDIDCDGEDCAEVHALTLDGMMLDRLHDTISGEAITVEALDSEDGAPSRIVIRRTGAGGGHAIRQLHGDRVLLRCSEGDATIVVDKDEADGTFLCPKHSTPMARVQGATGTGVHVIRKGAPREH